MKTQHTPGPWEYSPNRKTHNCCVHTSTAKEEFGYINHESGGVVGSSERTWIKDADGYLIAASPDLLAVCSRIVSEFDADQEISIGCIEDARAAIAKASRMD